MRISSRSLPILVATLALAACGDDTGTASDTQGSTGSASVGTSTTGGGTSAGTSQGSSGSTQGGSESDSASTSGSTGDNTTTATTSTTDTTGGDTTTDSSTTAPVTTTDTSTTGEPQICEPGSKSCFDESSYQVCADDGLMYDPPVACADGEVCLSGECYSECDLVKQSPSSVGCSFFATKMDNIYSNVNDPSKNDSLIAGNISTDQPVTAQLYFVPIGSKVEQPEGGPVVIPAKGTHTFILSAPEIDSITMTRQGGVYRLETDRPIVAYQHSPIGSTATNDASMLLPEHALTGNYVVVSYPGTIGPYPSYFTAISTTDNTKVDFTVKGATAGGGGIPALQVNQSSSVMLDRYGLLNLVVAQQQGGDLSGTIVSADGPLHLVGATECANVPNASQVYCDHMEEATFPLEYWGKEYVAPTAPKRNNEFSHWRVYGGEDNVTVTTNPVQPGFPKVLNKGEYYQFATKQSFIITGDGPFLPVGYLESQNPNAGTGDPGMYQMVPTAQFLARYAFVTGTNYNNHYAQIIRPVGGADVLLDGVVVGGYKTVGNFEVADVPTSEGAHFAESDDPFGIIQIGYTPVTSYAYPGGLKLEVINPQ
ncbi:MAG: IgGFc-binding protein [Myxococcales bacterium]|nr:IgGFc-binding protein [Myxococcales bacterium]MCB9706645.1 IgGFc-binding protein [Myxococcales bacterium]